MKHFKEMLLLTALTLSAEQNITAQEQDYDDNNNKDMQQTQQKPQRQGWGRFGTMFENTLTLHPGNAVNAVVTGEQDDTSFGYERDEQGNIKARKANTQRNRDNDKKKKQAAAKRKQQEKRKKEQDKKRKQAKAKKQKANKQNND